jgi:hypothetical protein
MRLSRFRPRFTVRRLMIAVAILANVLGLLPVLLAMTNHGLHRSHFSSIL